MGRGVCDGDGEVGVVGSGGGWVGGLYGGLAGGKWGGGGEEAGCLGEAGVVGRGGFGNGAVVDSFGRQLVLRLYYVARQDVQWRCRCVPGVKAQVEDIPWLGLFHRPMRR